MTPAGLTGNQTCQTPQPTAAHTPSHEDVNELQTKLLNEPSPAAREGQNKKSPQSRSVTFSARASAEEQSPGYKKVAGGYQCDHCNQRSLTPSKAKIHLRLHTGETPYQCEHCGKKFNVSFNLKTHLRIHTGEKPYECEYCGKAFNRSSSLTTHLRTHTGETPYQCEYCGKKFSDCSGHRRHLRLHTGEKPYQCEYCGKKFSDCSDYRRHLRLHTGEKPFKCKHCEFATAQKNSFNYHMKTRHQAPPEAGEHIAPPAKKQKLNNSVLPRSDLKKDNA